MLPCDLLGRRPRDLAACRVVRAKRANETVAALGERLDEARRLRRVTQRLPQALDGVVQPAIEIDEGVRRPDLPLELVPRHDLAGVVQQNAE